MVEGNESEYEARCASFYNIIDSDTPNETVATKTYIARYEILEDAGLDIKDMNDDSSSLEMYNENYWASLQVNMTDVDSMLLPEQGVYEPQ
jgi:hypothetical protein